MPMCHAYRYTVPFLALPPCGDAVLLAAKTVIACYHEAPTKEVVDEAVGWVGEVHGICVAAALRCAAAPVAMGADPHAATATCCVYVRAAYGALHEPCSRHLLGPGPATWSMTETLCSTDPVCALPRLEGKKGFR